MFAATVSTFSIDSIALPTWANDLIHSTRKAVVYSSIVFKAFGKTLAPQIIATTKDLSHYYIECGKGAGEWAMTAAGITHNPLQSAVRAAHAELTSAEAQATYRHIQRLTHETAMASIAIAVYGVVAVSVGIETAQTIYRHAKRVFDWVDALLNPTQPEPIILPSVDLFFAQDKAQENIAATIDEVRHERSFLMQLDRLDADALTNVQAKADDAISQAIEAKADQLKCDRAALALQTEGDRLASEALAFVVDRAVVFAMVEPKPKVSSANAVVTGKRTSRAKAGNSKTRNKATKAEPKTSAGKSRGVAMGK